MSEQRLVLSGGPVRPWRGSSTTVFQYGVFAVVALLVLIPVAFLVLGSFSTARLPTDFSFDKIGLSNYIEVWLRQDISRVFLNTAIYVAGATVFGIAVATILAWLVERSDVPGKLWIYTGVPMTLAIPGLLQAVTWGLLLSPRSGFVNHLYMNLTGTREALFNVYSLSGMIFVEGLRLVPTAFLLLVPLLKSMDPALEEAASMSGAGPLKTISRVTLKLMLPGIFAVSIYQAMTALEVFEVPGVLGMPVGIHVFSTRVYTITENIGTVPSFGQANALAIVYLLIAVVISFLYFRVVRRSERYAVVTGKAYRPRLVALGRWRMPAVTLVVLFLILSIAIPYLVLIYVSMVKYLQQPSIEALKSFSFMHYYRVFALDRFERAIQNTLFMVVGTATLVTAISFMVSMIVVRSRFRLRRTLDLIAFLPHSVPGIVLGLAFLWFFLNVDRVTGLASFGSVASLVIGFSVMFITYGTRAMNAAILQIHKDLDEAAMVSGASPWRTAWRVFLPLLMPTVVGVWIYIVLLSVRLAGLPLMLFKGNSNEILAVLIWYLWDEGEIESVGALGVLLMTAMFALVLVMRLLGFGRNVAQSGAP